jgi:hypothetical protein
MATGVAVSYRHSYGEAAPNSPFDGEACGTESKKREDDDPAGDVCAVSVGLEPAEQARPPRGAHEARCEDRDEERVGDEAERVVPPGGARLEVGDAGDAPREAAAGARKTGDALEDAQRKPDSVRRHDSGSGERDDREHARSRAEEPVEDAPPLFARGIAPGRDGDRVRELGPHAVAELTLARRET